MLALWTRLKLWAVGVGAALVALTMLFAAIRKSGRDAAERERQAARMTAIKEQREREDELAGLGSHDLDQRFDRWVRKDGGR